MPRALICMDEVPAADGSCVLQEWQEVIVGIPPMSIETAREISEAAFLAWASILVFLIVRRAA